MKVRARRYASGKRGWQLDLGVIEGRRVQLAFATRAEAVAELERRKGELRRTGERGAWLSDEERVRFALARDRLALHGGSIEEAVDLWVSQAAVEVVPCALEELVSHCWDAKWNEGRSKRYLAQIKSVGRAFARALAGRLAHDIVREDVERWLRVNEFSAVTWNSYVVNLRAIFAWGVERKFVRANPCVGVMMKKLVDDDVRFLSRNECRRLLRFARREAHVACVPFVVLGLFCGLRPDRELGEMSWMDVRLEAGCVVVSSGRAKSRQRRVVDLSANARAWLVWFLARCGGAMDEGTKIMPPNHRRRWKALRAAAGLLSDWPHDGLRHTFASMHLAHHRDEARLQLLMGHESAAMIYRHYRGVVTPSEAAKFWALGPPGGA